MLVTEAGELVKCPLLRDDCDGALIASPALRAPVVTI